MTQVTVNVDIDPWDVVDELDDEEIADYLRQGGYSVQKEPREFEELDNEDLNFPLCVVEDTSIEGRRVYNKLKMLRYG